MASGSFNVSTANQYIKGKVEWSSVVNVAGNYSDVTATLRLSRTNTGYTTYGNGSFTMVINGNSKTNSGQFTFTYNSNTLCITHTVRVYHNANGAKSITIAVSGSLPNTTLQMSSQSRTVTLDTIPRASTISTFNNFTIGSNIPVSISRASSGFTHRLELKYGNLSVAVRTGIGASTTLVLTQAEQDKLYNAMSNVTSGTVTLYCTTYSGGTKIGSTTSKTARANIGSSIRPTFSNITHSEAVSAIANNFDRYIQGKSRLSLAITGAVAGKGASIRGYWIYVQGENYGSRTATTGYLKWSGDLEIEAGVRDSRGREYTKTITVNVLAYSKPQIDSFRVDRCNSDGSLNPAGQYAKVQISGEYKSLNNKNTILLKISSKLRNVSNYTLKETGSPSPNFTLEYVVGTYALVDSYDFYAELIDFFERADSSVVLGTAKTVLDLARTGVGIGKYHEHGDLDVAEDMYIGGNIFLTGESVNTLHLEQDWSGWLYYRKNALGQVLLYGDVNTSAMYPSPIARLPAGYRPVELHTCTFYDMGEVKCGIVVSKDGYIHLGEGATTLDNVFFHTIFSTI